MDNVTDTVTVRQEEYECQLFGFSNSDLLECFKTMLLDQIKYFLQTCKVTVEKKVGPERQHLVQGFDQSLLNAYERAVETPLRALSGHLKRVINIPPHVLLPEDEVHRNQYTIEDLCQMQADVDLAKSKLIRALIMKELLERELKEAAAFQKHVVVLDSARKQIEAINVMNDAVSNTSGFQEIVHHAQALEVHTKSLEIINEGQYSNLLMHSFRKLYES